LSPSFEKRLSGENVQKKGGKNENFLKKLRWRALKKGRREAIIDASVPWVWSVHFWARLREKLPFSQLRESLENIQECG
jgi:hypothetical protein